MCKWGDNGNDKMQLVQLKDFLTNVVTSKKLLLSRLFTQRFTHEMWSHSKYDHAGVSSFIGCMSHSVM